ncbi:zinc-ribbon domain-containing protein [Sandaracinobacteroides saxicola]|uniref:Zinc-ribbon domain-containing protein n=1 Tax=Sandaracinobacteroides saxicola TaxID=2759707 RepID=A0A7G5IJP9_9SPHN|nr:zinc-ribbon domain-containing protein [Sandaracinobacteroides saxicola]QMW23591.1 zinc-ribbon domain-containing protein [Sandaracinobacteroides saxicola]
MILTCPSCGARYNVRADAIPAAGRKVRCKACAHEWLALPEVWELPEALPAGSAEPAREPEPAPAPAPAAAPEAPARRWPWLLVLALLLLGGGGALGWAVGEGRIDPARIPGWQWLISREIPGVRLPAPPPTALTLSATVTNRQVPGGGNVWEVTGRVVNDTRTVRPVPPIEVILYGRGNRELYRWQVAPPRPTLGPGMAVRFDTATVNTPDEASHVRVTLRPAALGRG